MTSALVILALVSLLLSLIYVADLDPTATKLRALHQALERGEISPDQYAAHHSALDR